MLLLLLLVRIDPDGPRVNYKDFIRSLTTTFVFISNTDNYPDVVCAWVTLALSITHTYIYSFPRTV